MAKKKEKSGATLFETSPVQDEDSQKRKKSASPRQASSDGEFPASIPRDWEMIRRTTAVGYIMSIDSVRCDRCGLPADLEEVLQSGWLVRCGWWCMHTWVIEPIPGLLESMAEESRPCEGGFAMRDGRFAGQTLSQIADSGNLWYIESIALLAKRTAVSEAAKKFLAERKKT